MPALIASPQPHDTTGLSPGYLGKFSLCPEKIAQPLLHLLNPVGQRLLIRLEDRLHPIRQLRYRIDDADEASGELGQLVYWQRRMLLRLVTTSEPIWLYRGENLHFVAVSHK